MRQGTPSVPFAANVEHSFRELCGLDEITPHEEDNNWKTIHLKVQARRIKIRKHTNDEEKCADCRCAQAITVPVGTTVTWTNSDDIPRTAVSTDGASKSKVMETDEKFS